MLACTWGKKKAGTMEVLVEDLTEQIAWGVSHLLLLFNINLLSVAASKPLPRFCQDMLKAFG